MNNNQLLSNYYSLHRDELVSYIAMRIADTDEAEDSVQDIFLHLLRGHQLITPQTLPALVYTMARHEVADYYRKRRVREEYEQYLRNNEHSAEIETLVSAHQLMEHMEHSLARLPWSAARIYRLYIYDGLKVGDIAKVLELPYKQVENHLGQARKHVRAHMRQCAG